MRDLNGQQVRQLIDMKQLYETLLQAEVDEARNFKGSMSWKRVHGRDYLYRKRSDEWKSVGPRSPDTERVYAQFTDGRRAAKDRIKNLKRQVEAMAPICRAMGLGRVPSIAARILRRLDQQRIIGHGLVVVGTHALFAYESLVSAHFATEHVATADIDLLFDARVSLKLVAPELKESGLIGLLQKVDRSFAAPPGSFRAANDDGFLVDLIMPQPRQPSRAPSRRQIGDRNSDQVAAEIEGLDWLQDSGVVSEIVIDEKGFPARILAPDPRAFAVHKAWLSRRPDREPGKKRRDLAQARAVAGMVHDYLPAMPFDDEALQAFPAKVRAESLALIGGPGEEADEPRGGW
jgi:hypothetical protein